MASGTSIDTAAPAAGRYHALPRLPTMLETGIVMGLMEGVLAKV
jgi:hypothetical protein